MRQLPLIYYLLHSLAGPRNLSFVRYTCGYKATQGRRAASATGNVSNRVRHVHFLQLTGRKQGLYRYTRIGTDLKGRGDLRADPSLHTNSVAIMDATSRLLPLS